MLPIVTPEQMRRIDAAAPEPVEELIERAARRVALRARAMLGGVYGRRVVAIAGPGNNGADARVAGEILARWGVRVTVVAPDIESVPDADLVIDGAFGTGTNRAYEPPPVPRHVPVLAVDIPSGIDGLTGARLGGALGASHTITFAALKPGLLLGDGPGHCGTIEVADIGLDVSGADAWQLTEAAAAELLPRRPRDTHKWKRAVFVIGGSAGMFGAPLLSARAALRADCGIVWCGLPGQDPPPLATEVVFRDLAAADWHDSVATAAARFGALVVGPGLGVSDDAARNTRALVDATELPMVIDGDGLRALGERPQLRENIVLTPHDGEFEALNGAPPAADRFASVRELAERTAATVLLKGPTTIVARPDGYCLVSTAGDQRLATAGSGDVLSGIVGSYLAAGLEPVRSAALAAWVHGNAAQGMGFGIVASDLVDGIPAVTARLSSATRHGDQHASN